MVEPFLQYLTKLINLFIFYLSFLLKGTAFATRTHALAARSAPPAPNTPFPAPWRGRPGAQTPRPLPTQLAPFCPPCSAFKSIPYPHPLLLLLAYITCASPTLESK
jgi:hypothetical protein